MRRQPNGVMWRRMKGMKTTKTIKVNAHVIDGIPIDTPSTKVRTVAMLIARDTSILCGGPIAYGDPQWFYSAD